MSTVYLLTDGGDEYTDYRVVGVFTTKHGGRSTTKISHL